MTLRMFVMKELMSGRENQKSATISTTTPVLHSSSPSTSPPIGLTIKVVRSCHFFQLTSICRGAWSRSYSTDQRQCQEEFRAHWKKLRILLSVNKNLMTSNTFQWIVINALNCAISIKKAKIAVNLTLLKRKWWYPLLANMSSSPSPVHPLLDTDSPWRSNLGKRIGLLYLNY